MAENITQSDKVYEYVLDKIKTNKWAEGEKIYSENKLSERLEVSRIAVREALEKFSALGILEKKKGAGTYVSKIDISSIVGNIVPLMTLQSMDILHVLKFRLHFEQGNIIEFMKNCTEEDIDELTSVYDEMKAHSTDSEDFYTADYRFHTIIARGTGNPIVISINEILTGILVASQELVNTKIGPEIGLRYHKSILEAIKSGDIELAVLMMKRHIEATIDSIQETKQ